MSREAWRKERSGDPKTPSALGRLWYQTGPALNKDPIDTFDKVFPDPDRVLLRSPGDRGSKRTTADEDPETVDVAENKDTGDLLFQVDVGDAEARKVSFEREVRLVRDDRDRVQYLEITDPNAPTKVYRMHAAADVETSRMQLMIQDKPKVIWREKTTAESMLLEEVPSRDTVRIQPPSTTVDALAVNARPAFMQTLLGRDYKDYMAEGLVLASFDVDSSRKKKKRPAAPGDGLDRLRDGLFFYTGPSQDDLPASGGRKSSGASRFKPGAGAKKNSSATKTRTARVRRSHRTKNRTTVIRRRVELSKRKKKPFSSSSSGGVNAPAVPAAPLAKDWIQNNTADHYQHPHAAESSHSFKDQKPFEGTPMDPIPKLRPYIIEESGFYRRDTPPVIVRRLMGEEFLPDWLAKDFRSQVRAWLSHGPEYHGYVWYPVRLYAATRLEDYTIYCTVVSRLHGLEELMQTPGLPMKARRQLALWQDTHQLLALVMEKTGFFTDEEIRGVADFGRFNEEDEELFHRFLLDDILADYGLRDPGAPVTLSYYDVFEPSLRHVVHQGELPDLTKPFTHIQSWTDEEIRHHEVLDEDLICLMDLFRKAPPRPQQSRDMYQILARRVYNYPRIWNCVTRMLFCSLGGLYEDIDSRVVANFYVRHELYRSFCLEPTGPDQLATWLYGFQCPDLLDRNNAVGESAAAENLSFKTTIPSKTKKGAGKVRVSKTARVVRDWRDPNSAFVIDTADLSEVPPLILVGNSKKQAAEGYCNMTSLCQFVLNEYITLLTHLSPGMHRVLQDLYWYREVHDSMTSAMDMVRSMFNSLYTPSTLPEFARDPSADQAVVRHWINGMAPPDEEDTRKPLAGHRFLSALAGALVPYLRWKKISHLAEVGRMQYPRSDHFQQLTMPSGACGRAMWSSYFMILVEALLYLKRRASLRYWSRLMKVPFLTCVNQEFTKISVTAHREHVKAGEKGFDGFKAMLKAEEEFSEEDRTTIVTVIRGTIDEVGCDPSYEWMAAVFPRVHLHPILTLRIAEYYYKTEMFTQTVNNVLNRIFEGYPLAFVYLREFFRILQWESAVKVYDLPADVTQAQKKALRASLGLVCKEDPMPADADVAYYCRAHLRFLHRLVDEHPSFVHERGTSAVFDTTVGRLRCKFDNKDTSTRGRTSGLRSAMLAANRGMEDLVREEPVETDGVRRVYTDHDAKLDMKECVRSELQMVHMIGKVLCLGTDKFVLCPRCAGYTFLSPDKFTTPLGLLCPRCTAFYHSVTSTEIEDYYRYTCCQCSRTLYRASEVHRYVLLDDTSPTRAPYYRYVYFCRRHNRFFIGTSQDTTSLTLVLYYLNKRVCCKRVRDPETGLWETVFVSDEALNGYTRSLLALANKIAAKERDDSRRDEEMRTRGAISM